MSIFSISKYDDLQTLWNNHQIETINLEYKSQIGPNEVAKDVSSFANAEGGVIIYGIDEDDGRPKQSNGIERGQNSERIQQIVSSSTAPEVPMAIDVIDNPSDNEKEFLVLKIPKSDFYIHQVTTSGKFYVRNNTTTRPHEYNPIELKENDIALRYEARFRNKLIQESFVQKKESKIFKLMNWNNGIIVSLVPHVRIPASFKITKEIFRQFFVNPKTSIVIYSDMPTTSNVPTSDGRMTDPRFVERVFLEINSDGSVFCCRQLGQGFVMTVFDPIFLTSELLHLWERILKIHPFYGGVSLRINLNGSIEIKDRHIDRFGSESGGRTVSDFSIEYELPPGNFDKKEQLTRIFEKWFEAVNIDDSLKLFPTTITTIEQNWRIYDKKIG